MDRVFDYLVPDELAARAGIGHRVSVNFANRELQGFVVAQKDASPLLRHQIKEILKAPDDAPLVNESMLRLTRWMADYYACSWGEALQAVLPAVVRTGRQRRTLTVLKLARSREETLAEIVRLEAGSSKSPVPSPKLLDADGHALEENPALRTPDSALSRSARYAKILRTLATFEEDFTPSRLAEKLGYSLAPFNTLRKQGWLTYEKKPVDFGGVGALGGEERVPEHLTGEQQIALDKITHSVDRDEFKTFLLFGITGSGKTEVYIRAIARAISHGKSAIVLVPEIALTPQTVRRFSHRFENVTFLHSSMTDAERREAWTRIKDGTSRVVVGPRSALFAPVKDLGLIVVDEEHEHTYKQDSTPRYNARDTAIMRARLEHAAVILGSATPCLETWKNAQEESTSCSNCARGQRVEIRDSKFEFRVSRFEIRQFRASNLEARTSAFLPSKSSTCSTNATNSTRWPGSPNACAAPAPRLSKRASRSSFSSIGAATTRCSVATPVAKHWPAPIAPRT